MSELKLTTEAPRHRIDVFTAWLPRIAVVLAFVFIGATKFNAEGEWVTIFEQIGFGQWFRYFTGAVQITGAVMLLLPWTRIAGAFLLGCTMIGAMATDLIVMHSIGFAFVPFLLLCAVVVTAVAGRDGG